MLKEMQGQAFFRSRPSEAWKPRVNLYETANCFFVCVELAGVSEQELDVQAVPGVLTIRGVRGKPNLPECPVGGPQGCDVSVHLMEIDSGLFERKIPLPADVHVERISAVQRSGYLWIVLPRTSGPQNP